MSSRSPRVGIYNRWLTTLGGGERYSLALASVLQARFEVDFLSHEALPRDLLEDRFHLKLGNINFRTIPLGTSQYLSRYTEEYSLFINATQGSSLPCASPQGILVVYFPLPLKHPLAYRIAKVLQRCLLLGIYYEGFYPAASNPRWRYSCGNSVVRIPMWPGRTLRPVTIELHLEPPPGAPLPYPVTICTAQDHHYLLEKDKVIRIREHPRDGELAARILSPPHDVPDVDGPAGVLLRYVNVPSYRRLFMAWLRKTPLRKRISELAALGELPTPEGVGTYPEIWSISDYTRRWVEMMWGRKSDLLYPPANLEGIKPLEKRNYILSVGRFFAGGHNKKHGTMIQVFKELIDNGLQGWELHLAGGTMRSGIHQEYLETLQCLGEGYPIHFHLDLPSSELQRLYGRAKLYWHAAGVGENPQRHPKRFEHFGITVVEAMAGGAVPVVIRGGGLPETVRHGVDGLLWEGIEEWKQQTMWLIHNPSEMERLRNAAVRRASQFGMRRFRHDLLGLLSQMGVI